MMDENISNDGHQNIDVGSSENAKQYKCKNKTEQNENLEYYVYAAETPDNG